MPVWKRDAPVDCIVLHESVTDSVEGMLAAFRREDLGAHFSIDPQGLIRQHADLAFKTRHAGTKEVRAAKSWNRTSVAVEVINPVLPKHAPKGGPWGEVLRGVPWAVGRAYLVPTLCQLEACAELLAWLAGPECPLEIPLHFPDDAGHRFRMRQWPKDKGRWDSEPGIVAHGIRSMHADGRFPALYAAIRLTRGLSATQAYNEAVRRAGLAGTWASLPPRAPTPS